MDYTMVIDALLALMAALITTFLVPYLRNKGQYFWVLTAVKAFEEVYAQVEDSGLIKEEKVREFLAERNIKINPEVLTAFIKRAVTELKQEGR